MKNFIVALVMLLVFSASASFAGECAGGSCSLNRVARRAVTVTREVVRVPVVVGRNVVVRTRDVLRSQPIRGRIVNRSTTVVNQ